MSPQKEKEPEGPNLDRAVAFYRDILGLEVNSIPAANMASAFGVRDAMLVALM